MIDYLALVGKGNTGYRDVFAPDSPMLGDEGDTVSMYSVVGETNRMKWRVWIPPGTRSLMATLFTKVNESDTKVLLRMGEPPVGGHGDVTPESGAAVDLANVLSAMAQGAEIPCYSPAGAGNVKLSNGAIDSPPVTTVGQWLYINTLKVPGDLIFEIVTRIAVDKAAYLNWYASAIWDDYGNPVPGVQEPEPVPAPVGEQWVFGRVVECGLIEPLAKLCKAKDDADLIQAAKTSGLWAALLKFTK